MRFREQATELDTSFTYTFYNKFFLKKLRIKIRPRVFVGGGNTNLHTELSKYFAFSKYQNHLIKIGLGDYENLPHSLAVFYKFNLRHNTTRLSFNATRLGTQYRTDFDYYILNAFHHPILDGTTDLSLKLSHAFSKILSVYALDDLVLTSEGQVNTLQVGVVKGIFEAFYRTYDSTSLLGVKVRL